MTALTILVANIGDYTGPPPAGYDSYIIVDTAQNIETLTPDEIAGLSNNDILAITSDDGSVALTIAQANALQTAYYGKPLKISVPSGDTLTLLDSEQNIQSLTPAQLINLSSIGVTSFAANNLSPISVAEYVSDVNTLIATGQTPNQYLWIVDTAANIQSLSPSELAAAAQLGLGQITSADGSERDPRRHHREP